MSKSKRHYDKILHYYLTHRYLNEESYHVVTSLQPNEIALCLTGSKKQMVSITETLSVVVRCQQAKLMHQGQQWLHYRNSLSAYDYLFSDAAHFVTIPDGYTDQQQAINLLSVVDRRRAIIWLLRFNIEIPDNPIIIQRPECIKFIINNITVKSGK
ncbi:hypothetical protein [Providencia burhodogranariea]